jgi:hypothetical protein
MVVLGIYDLGFGIADWDVKSKRAFGVGINPILHSGNRALCGSPARCWDGRFGYLEFWVFDR